MDVCCNGYVKASHIWCVRFGGISFPSAFAWNADRSSSKDGQSMGGPGARYHSVKCSVTML